jgi:hypothetical protein
MTAQAQLSIKELRPADGTSAAIRAAFHRLVEARAANAAEIARTEAARPAMLMSATSAVEIDKSDETVRRRRVFGEQLDILESELRKSFTIAKESEEDEEYDAKFAGTLAAIAIWNSEMQERYGKHAAAIIDCLVREKGLYQMIAAIAAMPAAERQRHRSPHTLLNEQMVKVYIAPNRLPVRLGGSVSIPGLDPDSEIWVPDAIVGSYCDRRTVR